MSIGNDEVASILHSDFFIETSKVNYKNNPITAKTVDIFEVYRMVREYCRICPIFITAQWLLVGFRIQFMF